MDTLVLELNEKSTLSEEEVKKLCFGVVGSRILEILGVLARGNGLEILDIDTRRSQGEHMPFPKVRIKLSESICPADATVVTRKLVEEFPSCFQSI